MRMIRLFGERMIFRSPDGPGAGRHLRRLAVSFVLLLAAIGAHLWTDGHPVTAVLGAGAALWGFIALCIWRFKSSFSVPVLGLGLGVSALMAVLAVASGFELELARSFARVHGHVLVTKYGLDFTEYGQLGPRIGENEHVVGISPFAWGVAAIVADPSSEASERLAPDGAQSVPTIVMLKGILPTRAQHIEGLRESLIGQNLSALRPADPGILPGIVVGESLAQRAGLRVGSQVSVVSPEVIRGSNLGDPMGRSRRARFEVTDLLRSGTSEIDDHLVLTHLSAAQSLLFGEARVTGIEFSLDDPRMAREFAETVEEELMPSDGRRLYRCSTWIEVSSSMQAVRHARAVIAVVLGLMVLVSSSSLAAALMLSVRQKRSEIAILMVLGCRRTTVFWLFEYVGLRLGVAGVFWGSALGAVLVWLLGSMNFPLDSGVFPIDHLPVALQPMDMIFPWVLALLTCGGVSGPVAHRASMRVPLEGLDHE